ncbi:MAG: relaxase/mobilization nuclease domain-containing protein [Oscillospiraceae bacterium]
MAQIKFITENAPDSPYETKYRDDGAVWDVIDYIFNEEKTCGYIGGWAVDPAYAPYEMALTAKLFHNDKGVRLRHWTVTFEEQELCRLESSLGCNRVMAVYRLGRMLSAYYANRYQIVFAVHCGARPHLHIVMNTVSYVDGKKFSGNRTEYYHYEKYVRDVARRYGFPIYIVKDHVATKYCHSY